MEKNINTNNGKQGGTLEGPSHDNGGIKVIITDDNRPVEVEGGEVIINKHAAKKHWKTLSKINQSAGNGVPIHQPKFKKGGNTPDNNEPTEKELEQRWDKKKTSIEQLANNIQSLRNNLTRDLSSEDEKTALTALVISIIDTTAERVGNEDSADNGHFGVTGFQKKHIKIEGNKVTLKYVGKSDVDHETSFTDEKIANALKKAISNTPSKFVFRTSDDFQIKADKINRYLSDFNVTAKDLRGYSANKWVIEKLKQITPEQEETKRKKQFNEIVSSVAEKIGHGKATLKNHYLVPELETEFVSSNNIIDIKKLGGDIYKKGRTIAQTPAPKKDRVFGSKLNKEGSSESLDSAKSIKFDEQTLKTIENKVKEHNANYPDKKINVASAKAVVRRGMGAYSSSHRPTITDGKANSRVAWGLARLNAFIYKIVNGKSKSGKYIQDDDLINELGYKVKKYNVGGEITLTTEQVDMKEYTLFVKKQIEDAGYYVSSPTYSKTNFGNSNYLYVAKNIFDENKIKVRISDHSVTNLDRMFNEIHLHYPPYENSIFNFKRAIKEIDFRLNKSKFFREEEGDEDYIVEMEVNENGLRPTDKVVSERLSTGRRGADRKIFKIVRINKKPVINWIDIRDDKIFKTIQKYKGGGNTEKLAIIIKNELGFYWLISKKDNDFYYEIDGDKRLYVVKDMAKRWGYKLVSPKEYNDFHNVPETIRMYDYLRKYDLGGNADDENKSERKVFFQIDNDYVGNLELGLFTVELGDYRYRNVFLSLSDAIKELFEFLKSENGLYLSKENPKSIYTIEKIDSSKKPKKRQDIYREDVFSIKAKDVLDLQSIYRLEKGGELKKGIEVESEHINTAKKLYRREITPEQAAESIAREHIKEDPNYYTKLKQIEKYRQGGALTLDYRIGDTIRFNYYPRYDEKVVLIGVITDYLTNNKGYIISSGYSQISVEEKDVIGLEEVKKEKRFLFFEKGGVANLEVEDYLDIVFAGGGAIQKAKTIITQKIGLSEENADYLISMSPKLAVWLADSIVKEEIRDFKLTPNQTQNTDAYYKQYVLNRLNERRRFIQTNYGGAIRTIIDWIAHPLTPKQNLKELSFQEAWDYANIFHEELKVLGGDIDYKEPEQNSIIHKYEKINDVEYYWVYIPSNFCNIESSRMGHCGRTGYGNTLISLRSIKPYGQGHTISDSHVTIAYNPKEGLFYQAKGKKNQKPAEKYNWFIFDLITRMAKGDLKLDLITERTEYTGNVDEVVLDFNGFGTEYDASEDYGFDDMSEADVRELYYIKPSVFDDFEGKYLLYDLGITKEQPETSFIIEKDAKNVDYLMQTTGYRSNIVYDILIGNTGDFYDNWSYNYEDGWKSAVDYYLDKDNEDRIIDEIVRITNYSKDEVKEKGIEHFLDGEDDEFDEDNFDNIKRAITTSISDAELFEYERYCFEQVKDALSELGVVKKLDDTGVTLGIELSNFLSRKEISGYMKSLQTKELDEVFWEAVSQSEIELPTFSIDDNFIPDPSKEDFNNILSDINLEQGYKKGGSLNARRKVAKVMHEWKAGRLHSGSKKGPIVKDQKQAIAIALSEAGLSKKAVGGSIITNTNKNMIVPTFVTENFSNNKSSEVFNIPDEFSSISEINKTLKNLKIPIEAKKILGKGSYGIAYLTKKNTVLKVTESSQEAFANYMINQNQEKLKSNAKVFNVFKITDGDKDTYLIEKEKIDNVIDKFEDYQINDEILSQELWNFINENLYGELNLKDTFKDLKVKLKYHLPSYKMYLIDEIETNSSLKAIITKRLKALVEFQKSIRNDSKKIGFDFDDIHTGNLGYNLKENKFVCFDCINNTFKELKKGGNIDKETYNKWKSLVNMTYTELKKFYDSQEGKDAGLSSNEANELGIKSGRESAKWIMKMKQTNVSDWTPNMWEWAKRQISFISRMSGNKGPLYDDKGNKTRKHTSLLIWGHNPEKANVGLLVQYAVNKKLEKDKELSEYKSAHQGLEPWEVEAKKWKY